AGFGGCCPTSSSELCAASSDRSEEWRHRWRLTSRCRTSGSTGTPPMTALPADRTAHAIEPAPTTPHGLVHVAEHGDDASWDRFVAGHPHSSAYLYSGWPRLIGRAFGHQIRMPPAEAGGGV